MMVLDGGCYFRIAVPPPIPARCFPMKQNATGQGGTGQGRGGVGTSGAQGLGFRLQSLEFRRF
jgi:hypothetical protein